MAAEEVCHDPRFPPLTEEELKCIWIEVSVLTQPEPVDFKGPKDLLAKIRPDKDGLILQKGIRSGLFLPQVWEEIPGKEDFMNALCYKAGLLPGDWKDPSAKISRFQVKAYVEKR
jgi:AmmeMemoRadiSam system protein A